MNFLTHLECSMCGKILEADHVWNLCPDCKKPLLARYDLRAAGKALNPKSISYRESNLWRYRELLPVRDSQYELCLGEGFTPLIKALRLSEILEFEGLFIKDEGINPTGSFKARGMSVATSRAYELGITNFSIPSAGNAAGALSAYAALADIQCNVFMPQDVPFPFIAECRAMGAEVTLVDGLISDAGQVAAKEATQFNRFDMSTLKEPYRLEGKKTMGYEIAEQMNWNLPDVIIYPTGGGTGLIGMWKAFDEMEKLGWIDSRRPRMVSVQSSGCAPIVKAFEENKEFAEFWNGATTIADGLRVPSAIGDFLILRALHESKGSAIAVSDEKLMDAAKNIGSTQGLFVCPETAATLVAFKYLRQKGWINDDESVVLFNTGSGLKYAHLWKS
ncbi:MAG: threonine synthase [Candidatus Neomarinimicrobiota bacterium]